MQTLATFIGFALLLSACTPARAPHGGSWEDFQRAKHALIVTYQAADVAGCELLGGVAGSSYVDMLAAKENAERQAVMLGADHLLFEQLESEWLPSFHYPGDSEASYAYGRAFRCHTMIPTP